MKKDKFKIAFTGPECSGKTTLSIWLATQLQWKYIPEIAREYLSIQDTYGHEDLVNIAKLQFEKNNQYGGESIVADTEMTVIKIWEEEKFNKRSEVITSMKLEETFDFYFLCKPDFSWEPDPLRENPNDRDRLFEKYLLELTQHNHDFLILQGPLVERKKSILQTLKTLGIALPL